MESTDRQARKIIERHEDVTSTDDQITAGISLFYFEEFEKQSINPSNRQD